MDRVSLFAGIGLISVSATLFTMERFIAAFLYAGESVPVKLSGSGSFPSEPAMPGLFDNILVGWLFILGLVFILFSLRGYLYNDLKRH
ncbi:hypothetical protein [Thalassobacillus devorans]|uniref:hypothetical protein n=1 Tax=Thalassobacillus devorans TaxID=279813 RepID=UPI000A1CE5C2|nr:hypothetical protein [Thalassobacillus devorans]